MTAGARAGSVRDTGFIWWGGGQKKVLTEAFQFEYGVVLWGEVSAIVFPFNEAVRCNDASAGLGSLKTIQKKKKNTSWKHKSLWQNNTNYRH